MKNKISSLAVALLCLLPVACGKKQESAKKETAAVSEAALRDTYGFATRAPRDTEAFVAVYDLGKLWSDLKKSGIAASLLANPAVQRKLAEPEASKALGMLASNPKAVKGRALLRDLLWEEIFVIFAPGCTDRLQALQQFGNEMRIQQVKSALAGGGMRPKQDPIGNFIAAYQVCGKSLTVPPMIFGAQMTSQKNALAAQLDRAEKKLPPGVAITPFQIAGGAQFKSLVLDASKLIPPVAQEKLKAELSKKTADPKAAEEMLQSILSIKVEVAYGFVGDYFVAAVGPDHSHLKIAANFGDSLLARPEVAGVLPRFTGKPVVSFSWCCAALNALSLPKYELTPWFARFKTQIGRALPEPDVKKLEADLQRIDARGAKFFPKNVSSTVSVAYRYHGICTEVFGGPELTGLASDKPLKFSGVPTDSTFFWLDARSRAGRGAGWEWIEDIASTGFDLFQRFGLPKLPDQQRMGFGVVQALALPKIVELYRITKDQLSESLGDEHAVAVDLGGTMPAIPMLPQSLLEKGRMIRLASLCEVRDRKLLGESWDGYFRLAREVATLIPATSKIPGGLPAPKSETAEGVTLSYYPLPIPTGDLLPVIATTDSTMVMSTSRSYAIEVSKAAAKPAPAEKPLALNLRISLKAAWDFLDRWMIATAENPDVVFAGKKNAADQFRRHQPELTALLKSLRSLDSFEYRVFVEDGQTRATARFNRR